MCSSVCEWVVRTLNNCPAPMPRSRFCCARNPRGLAVETPLFFSFDLTHAWRAFIWSGSDRSASGSGSRPAVTPCVEVVGCLMSETALALNFYTRPFRFDLRLAQGPDRKQHLLRTKRRDRGGPFRGVPCRLGYERWASRQVQPSGPTRAPCAVPAGRSRRSPGFIVTSSPSTWNVMLPRAQ